MILQEEPQPIPKTQEFQHFAMPQQLKEINHINDVTNIYFA